MTHEEVIAELEWIKIHGFKADKRIIGTNRIQEAIEVAIDALEKLEDLKWLMENYPIRIDRYDTEHGNRDFVLGVESMREYVLDVLNGEISVDIEALKAEDDK